MHVMTQGPEPSRQIPSPPPNVTLTGDRLTAAQEQLVIEHLLIVRFIARRIHERLPQHVLIDDLYSAGVVGLLAAVGRSGPSWGLLFRSYAQFRIRGAILDSLRTLD
jgi:RNA polymerase sigma factor for flagellar operon FliA